MENDAVSGIELVALTVIAYGLSKRRSRIGGGGMKLMSILTLVASMTLSGCAGSTADHKTPSQNDRQSRLQVAEAMFQERCKGAGEKIYRTVEDVDGLLLLKVRPDKINFSDQFDMDDPYGRDLGGDGYIKNFLLGRDVKGSLVSSGKVKNGYRYVEAIDQKDGNRYRYTGSVKAIGMMDATAPNVQLDLKRNPSFDLNIYAFVLERIPVTGATPRYGVIYDDISTHEEREYWIAGGSLKVIDLETNEVLAERVGYMMDRGQGNKSGGRSPWLLAAFHACPGFPTIPGGRPFKMNQTRDFVEKVLQIKQ